MAFGTNRQPPHQLIAAAPNTETEREQRGQIVPLLVAGVLVNCAGVAMINASATRGYQRTTTVREVEEPAPQQRADQRAHFKQGKALNRHLL